MFEIFDEHEYGQNLRVIRKARGLTQKELAERIGVTTRAIQNYEAGRVPKKDILVNIAKALNVDVILFQMPTEHVRIRLRSHLNEKPRSESEELEDLVRRIVRKEIKRMLVEIASEL